jgi:hypothetical protein
MDLKHHREAFIPYRRADIIHLCLAEGRLDAETAQEFQSFCEILAAFYHFQFHGDLETIKDNYVLFNPDTDVKPLNEPTLADYETMGDRVVSVFERILKRANYRAIPQGTIDKALADQSLIALHTQVDFDDFDQLLCYYRGATETSFLTKKFVFWQQQQSVDILERMVLLIKFKGEGYFRAKQAKSKRKSDGAELKFTPGKMYAYFYKNIPILDLDLLFPNIQTSMTWRDRLTLAVPAIAAAVSVLIRTLPNLLLLFAAILLAVNGPSTLQSINVEEEQVRNVMPVLVASLTLLIALGGFGFRQYTQYKNKQIKFQKDVTDTLFFKNLATNASVFQMLVDLAEEEECKEIILVYYHLLTHGEPLTPDALDAKIEAWMLERTGAQINFDIQGPLKNLQRIRGRSNGKTTEQPLMTYDEQGRCRVMPLRDARAVLDFIWDNVFHYNGQ